MAEGTQIYAQMSAKLLREMRETEARLRDSARAIEQPRTRVVKAIARLEQVRRERLERAARAGAARVRAYPPMRTDVPPGVMKVNPSRSSTSTPSSKL